MTNAVSSGFEPKKSVFFSRLCVENTQSKREQQHNLWNVMMLMVVQFGDHH